MNEKKLAEWAGFVYGEIPNALFNTGKYWEPPDGSMRVSVLPDFTQSLDACFKWLVPKLIYCSITKMERDCGGNNWICEVRFESNGKRYYGDALANDPALVFCLALEKLIDAEGKC